ncbi:SpaH/EbpB family LPXTG-anchored major pilin [Streptococcus suis]|uniref:SpaH/EbpB family LPXTG-anchored major pilin n=1 Tax=Streptococcus suis TaxID=1307 RepID=UPI002FCC8A87
MKRLTKVFSALASLILVLAPVVANADVDTTPAQTTVAIHKLISKDERTIKNPDGSALTDEQLKNQLGDVEPMKGVKFQWFKVNDTDTVEALSKLSLAKLKETYTTTGITPATDDLGTTTFTVNKADYGLYWVVELANDGSEASKKMQVASTVPMLITLPFGTESGYLDTVNVYPKNKVETPTPGKDVTTLGNNDSGTKVGDTVKWFLKGTIPVDIKNYTTYTFNDTLSQELDYSEVKGVRINGSTESFVADTDYTVNYEQNSRKLTVALTESGIAKVAKYREDNADANFVGSNAIADATDGAFVVVELDTVLNEKAVPGKAIENETTITYDNPYNQDGQPKETPPSDRPEAHEGGKRFVKVDAKNKTKKLAGAEFELYSDSSATQAVVWTQKMIDANKAETDNAAKFKNVAVGQAVVLVSGADGTFDIQGLAYGAEGDKNDAASSTYYLKETKAPSGYTLPVNNVFSFEVNKTSYLKDPTATDLVPSEAKEVENKKTPELPMTGGIGAALFIIAGLALMAFAGYKMKQRNA